MSNNNDVTTLAGLLHEVIGDITLGRACEIATNLLPRLAAQPKPEVVDLTDAERQFLVLVIQNPGGKLRDMFDADGRWTRPEERGLVRCTGSWKWEPVDLMACMRAVVFVAKPEVTADRAALAVSAQQDVDVLALSVPATSATIPRLRATIDRLAAAPPPDALTAAREVVRLRRLMGWCRDVDDAIRVLESALRGDASQCIRAEGEDTERLDWLAGFCESLMSEGDAFYFLGFGDTTKKPSVRELIDYHIETERRQSALDRLAQTSREIEGGEGA